MAGCDSAGCGGGVGLPTMTGMIIMILGHVNELNTVRIAVIVFV